jgi:hypothetical protein
MSLEIELALIASSPQILASDPALELAKIKGHGGQNRQSRSTATVQTESSYPH